MGRSLDEKRSKPLIAHVIHRLATGGMENGVVNLLNNLPGEHYGQVLISLTDTDTFRERIRNDDIALHQIGKHEGKDPAAYVRLWRLLRGLRPVIVHTRNLATVECQWVARAAGVGHGIHGEHGWEVDDLHGRRPRNRLLRRLCRPAVERYVAVSGSIADYLVNEVGVERQRVTRICNGVDAHRFSPGSGRVVSGLPEGFLAPGSFVVGTVGRMDAVKDQVCLVRALSRLVVDKPSVGSKLRLVMVGDGPERGRLEELVSELDLGKQVWFAGMRDDPRACYSMMDLFVLPSLAEGISNTILEAMASGLPVVATRVGGNPELVVDGVTGTLFPAGDVHGLADIVGRYAEQVFPGRAFGAAGRERVEREFSLDSMVRRYDRLYRDVLGIDGGQDDEVR